MSRCCRASTPGQPHCNWGSGRPHHQSPLVPLANPSFPACQTASALLSVTREEFAFPRFLYRSGIMKYGVLLEKNSKQNPKNNCGFSRRTVILTFVSVVGFISSSLLFSAGCPFCVWVSCDSPFRPPVDGHSGYCQSGAITDTTCNRHTHGVCRVPRSVLRTFQVLTHGVHSRAP